jgi:uroporphyrinogen decarboxylase
MNHRERIHAALRSEPVDHVPVALWRHFPGDDLRAETLAARVVEFQRKYDFDFVKVTPASGYPSEMYGATFRAPSPGSLRLREGTRERVTRPVNRLEDWDKIVPLDATNPVFVRELSALKLIRAQVGNDVHILQTIFSPLYAAGNLGGERALDDFRQNPAIVQRAMRALTETTIRFAIKSLRAGADAIFFATQHATADHLTIDEHRIFAEPYDRQVLEAVRAAKADFIFLHIHGLNIFFDELTRYPVDVINWHDRRTAPSLKQARAKWNGVLAGGIDEASVLGKSRDDVIAQVRDAVTQTNNRGFILTPGCVMPIDTPAEYVRAVIDAARAG